MEIFISHPTKEETILIEERDDLDDIKEEVVALYDFEFNIHLYHEGILVEDIKSLENGMTLTVECSYQKALDELKGMGIDDPEIEITRTDDPSIVKLILEVIEPADVMTEVLINDNMETLKLLLEDPRVDPSENNNSLIVLAAEVNNVDAIKLLMNDPRVNPADNNNAAAVMACNKRHGYVLEHLLKHPKVTLKNYEVPEHYYY